VRYRALHEPADAGAFREHDRAVFQGPVDVRRVSSS
jgi:hypothetical protein